MMISQRTALLAGLLALSTVLFTGCDSAMVAPEDSAMERGGLARRSKAILERYDQLLDETEFVIAVSPTVLSMQAILERYDALPGVNIKGHYRRAINGFAVHVDKEHVQHLFDYIEADPDILTVERDGKVRKPQSGSSRTRVSSWQVTPWGLKSAFGDILPAFLNLNVQVKGVDVYLLDSGISPNRDLNIVENVNFTPASSTDDRVLHGIPVASIIGALDNRYGSVGLAPGVRLHNFKVLGDDGTAELSVAIAALERVMEHRSANPNTPIVVNMSFGADIGTTAYNALDQAVERAVEAGIVVVVAAGNGGIDAGTVSPAHAAGAITVGAHDRENDFARFSNHGAAVDILAPGSAVEVLLNQSEYGFMTGTSAAAPHVTGAAALYLSLYPSATPQQVRDALVEMASPGVDGVPSGTTSRALTITPPDNFRWPLSR